MAMHTKPSSNHTHSYNIWIYTEKPYTSFAYNLFTSIPLCRSVKIPPHGGRWRSAGKSKMPLSIEHSGLRIIFGAREIWTLPNIDTAGCSHKFEYNIKAKWNGKLKQCKSVRSASSFLNRLVLVATSIFIFYFIWGEFLSHKNGKWTIARIVIILFQENYCE